MLSFLFLLSGLELDVEQRNLRPRPKVASAAFLNSALAAASCLFAIVREMLIKRLENQAARRAQTRAALLEYCANRRPVISILDTGPTDCPAERARRQPTTARDRDRLLRPALLILAIKFTI